MKLTSDGVRINKIDVSAYKIPTESPESDGTLEWQANTIVVVQVSAGNQVGLGYTYAHRAAAVLIREKLCEVVAGTDALAVAGTWEAMGASLRNFGESGIGACAIAAIDIALWDLKARILETSLASLLGTVRDSISVYGSGGFTSYDTQRLKDQLSGWVQEGLGMVKMKVGRNPEEDPERVAAAREAITGDAELFVDANGAYSRKQALAMAEEFSESDVQWFEEPVSPEDLHGLKMMRDGAPSGMDIASGEYGYRILDFRRLLEHDAVDVLQVDATRCMGITGFLQASSLCSAYNIPLSGHGAPQLHAPLCCASKPAVHLEYFHDHVLIEQMLFDGVLALDNGELRPDKTRPGLGLVLKKQDAAKYAL